MNSRYVWSLLLAGAVIAVACVDMSAPKGPAAISVLKLPSPSVVVGDTMRDSLGHAAPILVNIYDSEQRLVETRPPDLFITDSAPAASVLPVGLLFGLKLGTVNILGQVNQLQTPLVNIPVTVRPTTITLGVTPDTFRIPLSGDTSQKAKTTLPVLVTGDTGVPPNNKRAPSQGIIVHFALVSAPPSATPGFPAVYIGDANGKPMNLDTSDAGGNANHRFLVVVPARLANTGTATVNVTSSYAGVLLEGSNRQFVIPIDFSPTASFSATLRR